MGEKDIIEKTLVSYNDVFSDIYNGFLFKGKQVIKEDQLTNATTQSIYKADGKYHQQDRDVAKYWNNSMLRTAMFGIENQSAVNPDMPLRIISYDGAAYRHQLDEGQKERYPVVTIVLYFGKGSWQNNHRLHDVLNIPEELKPFVNDYKVRVFPVSKMTEKQLSYFHSDFKLVADYFVKVRKDSNYRGSKETIKHVKEFFRLMSIFTGDNRFEKAYNNDDSSNIVEGGRPNNMCEFLDKIENEGIEQGIEQVILNMIEQKLPNEQIKLYTKAPEEKINEIREKLSDIK